MKTLLGLVLVLTGACTGTARGLEAYRVDTQQQLATRDAQIKRCYDAALQADGKLAGSVAIRFTVEKKTGEFSRANIDTTRTTAPKPLGDCVLTAVQGLKLEPPDRNEGRATFVYQFNIAPATPAS